MTELPREQVAALLDGTTPGPWETAVERREDLGCDHIWIAPKSWLPRVARVVVYPEYEAEERANARLLTAAPDLARQLLAAMDRLADAEAQVAALREAAQGVTDQDAKPEYPGRYSELRLRIEALRTALAAASPALTPAEQQLFDQSMAMREAAGQIAKEQTDG